MPGASDPNCAAMFCECAERSRWDSEDFDVAFAIHMHPSNANMFRSDERNVLQNSPENSLK